MQPVNAFRPQRADEGSLNAARAIQRAKTGELVDGASATCAELDELIRVDREAVVFEKDKIGARFTKDKKSVQTTEEERQAQSTRLKKIRKKKGCSTSGANLQQATDFEVYKRADEDTLNAARVIERAKAGEPKIDVIFEVNTNGLLTVTARDQVTGAQADVKLQHDRGRLTPEEIDRMCKEAEEMRAEDERAERENLAAMERGDDDM